MIKVRHLSKRFGATLAMDSLDFAAEPGQILGFLGPNDAGKTTTVRIRIGFFSPSAGMALWSTATTWWTRPWPPGARWSVCRRTCLFTLTCASKNTWTSWLAEEQGLISLRPRQEAN
ncbi:hypothetical protein DFAR_4030007 [Desulfarculales bacterium]